MKWFLNLDNIVITSDEYVVIFLLILVFILGILNLFWCSKKVKEKIKRLIKSNLNEKDLISQSKVLKRMILVEGFIYLLTILFYGLSENIYLLLIGILLSIVFDFILFRIIGKNNESNSKNEYSQNQELSYNEGIDQLGIVFFIILIAVIELYFNFRWIFQ